MKNYFCIKTFLKFIIIIICFILIFCVRFLNQESIIGLLLILFSYLFIISFSFSVLYFTFTAIFSTQYKLRSFEGLIDYIFSFFKGAWKLFFLFLIIIFVFLLVNLFFNINNSDIINFNIKMFNAFNDFLYRIVNFLTIPGIIVFCYLFIIFIFDKFFKKVNISIIHTFYIIFIIWFMFGPFIFYFLSLDPATIISILGFIITLIIFVLNYIIFNKNIPIAQLVDFNKKNNTKSTIRLTNNSNKEILINKVNFNDINKCVNIVLNKGTYFDFNFCCQENNNFEKMTINFSIEYYLFKNKIKRNTIISTHIGNITIQDIPKSNS